MKILFYVGYQKKPWNGNTEEGLAGSEIAVINIAENLALYGYKIVVSGNVKNAKNIRGVEYCDLDKIHDLHGNTFDILVGTSYAHFGMEFFSYTKAKNIFWAHNTEAFSWYNGTKLSEDNVQKILSQDEQFIDYTVTLTSWHSDKWSKKYNWPASNQIKIGNGINTSSFVGHPTKNKNSFIWSSAIDRDLVELLKNWPRIKGVLADATLNVYWPEYSSKFSQMQWIEENKKHLEPLGVTFHGPVSQVVLHRAMLESDFWCYVTNYEETYCITALEMQYARVLPIVTKVAALKETVHSGIILENDETKWDKLVETLRVLSPSLKTFAKEKAHKWAKRQTWSERASDWREFFLKAVDNKLQ